MHDLLLPNHLANKDRRLADAELSQRGLAKNLTLQLSERPAVNGRSPRPVRRAITSANRWMRFAWSASPSIAKLARLSRRVIHVVARSSRSSPNSAVRFPNNSVTLTFAARMTASQSVVELSGHSTGGDGGWHIGCGAGRLPGGDLPQHPQQCNATDEIEEIEPGEPVLA